MDELVSVDALPGGVVEVVLQRPEKMNALTVELVQALVDAAERVGRDPRTRVVVLRGAGRAFCAGLDVSQFEKLGSASHADPDHLMRRTHGDANLFQRVATVWADLPVPVVAALHGVVFGGGLQIALGADVRYAAPDTRLSVMEIKWGLVPDMAGMVLMRGLLRDDVARELTFSGRIVEAAEAAALGLVTRVFDDPVAKARDLADEIARKSPRAIRAAKRLLGLSRRADAATVLLAESREQNRLIGSKEQAEAVAANLGRRAAEFEDSSD